MHVCVCYGLQNHLRITMGVFVSTEKDVAIS